MRLPIFLILVSSFFSCNHSAPESLDGAALATTYCASCHQYPSPVLLDQKSWQHYILPRMGYFMGIYQHPGQRDSLIETGAATTKIEQANIFPKQPILTAEEWQAIQGFYLDNAPKDLTVEALALDTTSLFKPNFPNLFFSPPSTTFLSIAPNQLFFADANKKSIYQLDANFKLLKQAKVGEGLVHMKAINQQLWGTIMGSFSPTDQALGSIFSLSNNPALPSGKKIEGLQRPVHSSYADFNGDGNLEVLISEYGKWTGALSLWQLIETGTYQRQNIVERSGTISTHTIDINSDGLLDFIALFGQGNEAIDLFINEGDLRFTPKRLIDLSPSHGSSSLSLIDFNQDGLMDILYTAGDNADFPPITKPYHGIYLFIQEANRAFKQAFFLPLPGAYQAIAKDFDQDGDLDIAAISFFPDYEQQPTNFVFYENNENEFKPFTLPHLAKMGRWMVMTEGDLDQDGDLDLVLGSLTLEVPNRPDVVQNWVKNGLPFVFLENTLK